MKKTFLFLSAACIVASAYAIDKRQDMAAQKTTEFEAVKAMNLAPRSVANAKVASKKDLAKKVSTRADETEFSEVFYRPAENVWALGNSTLGWGYQGITFGFASSVGDIVFNNLSTNASNFNWEFSQIGAFDAETNDFIYETSNTDNLIVKGNIGEMATPVLSAGSSACFPDYVVEYICGLSGADWFGSSEEKGTYGVSPYQNFGMKNPQGYTGMLTYDYSYDITGIKYDEYGNVDPVNGVCPFNENGVYTGWIDDFKASLEEDGYADVEITDLEMMSYSFMIPKPQSTYMLSAAWAALNVNAVGNTMLTSYIYEIDDNGIERELPIAIGYASIVEGENYLPIFEYYMLNEDGDELEEPIFINSEIRITVEGFNGNAAITDMCPAVGFYPFSYEAYRAGNTALIVPPTLYIDFGLKLNGEYVETQEAGGIGLYYFDQSMNPDGSIIDPSKVTFHSYHQMTLDAVFPFMETIGGEKSVNIPDEGGEVTVELQSYFGYIKDYLEDGWYTLSAPEWVAVDIKEMDTEGANPISVSAEASEAGREGDVIIEGLGTTFTLHVIQGDGSAVSSIVVDKNAEYFDLQGRRVANPDKGIYIKKAGNKAEKVLF